MTADTATEQTLALLRPDVGDGATSRVGYLDVLGTEIEAPGAVQRLMRSSAVTRIYEDWWRPAFGRLAKGLLGPGMAEEHRVARLLLALSPGDRVLDVACGPGNFSRDFARVVGDTGLVVGIDASRPMLERAVRDTRRTGVSNIVYVHGDALDLPFRNRSFDGVCCFAALHLFPDPFEALDEMRRVLVAGGRIALFTSCRSRSAPLRAVESVAVVPSGIRMFEQDEIVEALQRRTFGDIRQRLAGLTQFVGARLD